MGKGRFVNQKLGKNVSRKLSLLKSELAGYGRRNDLSRRGNPPSSPKASVRTKP